MLPARSAPAQSGRLLWSASFALLSKSCGLSACYPLADIPCWCQALWMSRALNGLTIAAVAAWSVYFLYVLVVALRLAKWLPASSVVPALAIPIAMIAAALWVRFWLASRLKGRRLVLVGQLLVFAAACLFIVSVVTPRA